MAAIRVRHDHVDVASMCLGEAASSTAWFADIDEQEAQLQATIAEKDAKLEEKGATIAEKDAKLKEKDAKLEEKGVQSGTLSSDWGAPATCFFKQPEWTRAKPIAMWDDKNGWKLWTENLKEACGMAAEDFRKLLTERS